MGLTEFARKQTPHLTPTLILGTCAFLGPFLAVWSSGMESLANKKVIEHLGLEVSRVVGLAGSAACTGLFAFMSQTYGRYLHAKDERVREERRKEEETNQTQTRLKTLG